MTVFKWVIVVFMVAFVIPFFVYLYSRLQMTAWMNAADDWLEKKANGINTKGE